MREVQAYTEHKNPRGLYEKEVGSGVWWIRYADGTGRIHREKIGSFNRAKNAYTMRKADVLYNKKFPDTMRVVPVAFRQIAADALAYLLKDSQAQLWRRCNSHGTHSFLVS